MVRSIRIDTDEGVQECAPPRYLVIITMNDGSIQKTWMTTRSITETITLNKLAPNETLEAHYKYHKDKPWEFTTD